MKLLLIALSTLIVTNSFGQTSSKIDSLTFCSTKYKVPTDCSAESEYQLKCDSFSILWLYMNDQMLQSMPEQFVNQMAGQMKKFKKEQINCYLLDQEVKGYKISFRNENAMRYQLIAYGSVKGQPVLVQLSLSKEPKTNEDIPDFPRRIIQLTK